MDTQTKEKEEKILNLDFENTNEEVRKALINICGKNLKLKRFINKFFKENPDADINAWEDYGWEWDIEIYGGEDGGELAICNHDYRDFDDDMDGWFLHQLEPSFALFMDDFSTGWEKVTLPNGKVLMLIDEQDYFSFHIFDRDNMEDGKVDFWGMD